MNKTKLGILEDMLIKKETIKSDSSSLRVENTSEGLQASITCIESNKLEQETREGYNKFDIEDGTYNSNNNLYNLIIKNGECFVETIDTNNVSTGVSFLLKLKTPLKLKSGESYTIVNGINANYPYINLRTNVSEQYEVMTSADKGIHQFTSKDDVEIKYLYVFYNTDNKLNFSPMLLEGSYTVETMPDFEQYGAMPSKDFQSPVEGVTGDVKCLVRNKNLAYLCSENSFYEFRNGKYVKNSNYNCFIARVKPNTTYYAQNIHSNLCYFDKNMNFLKGLAFGEAQKFNTNDLDNVCYVTVAVEKEQSNKVMIEESSEPTDYAQHKEQNFTILLGDKKLYKGDKIVRKDNKWYFAKKWGEIIFDGINNKIASKSSSTQNNQFYSSQINNIEKTTDNTEEKNIFSNYFKKTTTGNLYNYDTKGISITISGNITFGFGLDSGIDTVEKANTWLQTNNLEVVYPLETSELELIEDENLIKQLDAILLYISEYKDLTNFDFDNDVIFEITVEKDKLRILENRLDNAEQNTTNAQILALESEV